MSSPSQGELCAGFGGDLDMLTDYNCGVIDEDGMPYDDDNYNAGAGDDEDDNN